MQCDSLRRALSAVDVSPRLTLVLLP